MSFILLYTLLGISFFIVYRIARFNMYEATWDHERRDFTFIERTTLAVTSIVSCYHLILLLGRLING